MANRGGFHPTEQANGPLRRLGVPHVLLPTQFHCLKDVPLRREGSQKPFVTVETFILGPNFGRVYDTHLDLSPNSLMLDYFEAKKAQIGKFCFHNFPRMSATGQRVNLLFVLLSRF